MGTVLYKIAYGPRGMAIYNIGPKMWPKHWKCEKCRFYHFYVILVNVPWIYMIFIMGWDGNSIVKACPWSQGDGHIYYSGWLDPKSVQNIEKVEM